LQFIAECGIEYGCQFVTQIFVNPPDCLYTKEKLQILPKLPKIVVKNNGLGRNNAVDIKLRQNR
jgi:hypothetical protein